MVNIKLLDKICKTEIELFNLYKKLITENNKRKEIITKIKSLISKEEELFTPFRANPTLAKDAFIYLKNNAKINVDDEISVLFSKEEEAYIIKRILYILEFLYLLDKSYFKAWVDPNYVNLLSSTDYENAINYLSREIPYLELSFYKSLYNLMGIYQNKEDINNRLLLSYLNPALESELLENDFKDLPLTLKDDININNHVPKDIKQLFFNQYFGNKIDNIFDYMINNDEVSINAILYFKTALLYLDALSLRDTKDAIPFIFEGNDILIDDLLETIEDNSNERKRLNTDYKLNLSNLKEYNLCNEDIEIYEEILKITKEIFKIYQQLETLEKQGLKNTNKYQELINKLKELLEEENSYYEYFRCNKEISYYLAIFLQDNSDYTSETSFTTIIDYDDEDAFIEYRIINKLFNISYEDETIFYETLFNKTINAAKKDKLSQTSIRDIIVSHDENVNIWIIKFLSEEHNEDIDTINIQYLLSFMSITLENKMIKESFKWKSIKNNFSESESITLKPNETTKNTDNLFGENIILCAVEELMNYIDLDDLRNKRDIAILLAVLKTGLLYVPLDKLENIKLEVYKLLSSYDIEEDDYTIDELKETILETLDNSYANYIKMNKDTNQKNKTI